MTPLQSWIAIIVSLGVLALIIFGRWPNDLPTVQAGEKGVGGTAGDSVATVSPRLTAAAGATVFDQEADVCDCFLCTQTGDVA